MSILFLWVYGRSLFIQPAGDDWWLIHPVNELIRKCGVGGTLLHVFGVRVFDFYRPLALIPMMVGRISFPLLQAIKLVVFLLAMLLVVRTGRRLGLSREWSFLVGAITLLHQIAASVVTEIDLWGEVFAMMAFVGLVDCCAAYVQSAISTVKAVAGVALLSTVCMLSKEAGVVCFAIPILFLVLQPYVLSPRLRRGLLAAAGIALLLTAVYLGVRMALGIASIGSEDGYYSLHLGLNVIQNLAFAVVGLLSPVDTVHVVLDGEYWRILAVLWTAGLVGVVGCGCVHHWRSRSWRLPTMLCVAYVVAQGPILLMQRLPEANLTRSLPLGWLAIALALSPLLAGPARRARRFIALAIVILWFGFDISAAHGRSTDIVTGQRRAARYRTEIKTRMPQFLGDTLKIAVMDPGYQGHAMYRQPLRLDMICGEVPDAFREMYPGSRFAVDCAVVKNEPEARESGAQFFILDDGSVVDLRSSPDAFDHVR